MDIYWKLVPPLGNPTDYTSSFFLSLPSFLPTCVLHLLHLSSDLFRHFLPHSPPYLLPLTSHLSRYRPPRRKTPDTLVSHYLYRTTGFMSKTFVHLGVQTPPLHLCLFNAGVNILTLSLPSSESYFFVCVSAWQN